MKTVFSVVVALIWCVVVWNVDAIPIQYPVKGAYINWASINWSDPTTNINVPVSQGYNFLILAFHDSNQPNEMSLAWAGVAPDAQLATIQNAHANGANVLLQVRIGDNTTQYNDNATKIALDAVAYVQKNLLDGIDFYLYEVPNINNTVFLQWIIELHTTVRAALGSSAIITHSLQPWEFGLFDPDTIGYKFIYNQIGTSIDLFNVMYYNDGDGCLQDYSGIFISSACTVNIAVKQINTLANVPLNKIAVVKAVTTADGAPGFVDAAGLHQIFKQAKIDLDWNTGVVGYVYNFDRALMGEWIDVVYAEEPPTAPVITVIRRTGDTIIFSWKSIFDGFSPITSFTLYRNDVEMYTGMGQNYTDTGLTIGTVYTYRVVVINQVGSNSTTLQISTIDVPRPPSSPTIIATGPTFILLTWNGPTADQNRPVVGYKLTRNGGNPIPMTSTTYNDTNLQPGTQYSYTLVAYNDLGSSTVVSTSAKTAFDVPASPSWIQVNPSATWVWLAWRAPDATGGTNITNFVVKSGGNSTLTYQTNIPEYNVTGLKPNTFYIFAVAAVNQIGQSIFSDNWPVTTDYAPPPPPTPPPGNVIIPCPPYSSDANDGNGCVCNKGYVMEDDKCTNSATIIAVAVVVPVVVIAFMIAGVVFYKRRANQEPDIVEELYKERSASDVELVVKKEYLTTNLITEFKEIKIVKKLGMGGSGVVYVGVWRNIDVAVKEYKDQNIETTDFIRESEIHAKLRHPNVVQLLAICLPPNLCAISEFMHKGSLMDVLQQNPPELTWQLKLQMLLDIARGMDYLHKSKIIHRDLKSQNVLVDKNWSCKIADFGTSKLLKEDATATVYVPRTAQWSAPEVITTNAYSEKSDVYSYGVIMWEVLTNKLPFEGEFAYQVEDKIVHGKRLPIPEGTEKWYEDLMERCWHASSDERPTFEAITVSVVSFSQDFEHVHLK